MRVRTLDGQVFDAWLNSPENELKTPAWLGQLGAVSDTRTEIVAPDGSQLTIGPRDIVINEHGRLRAMQMRVAQRLFYIEDSGEASTELRPVVHPVQPENIGRARQGMVSTDRGRLQPDNALAGKLSDESAAGDATTASDRGAAAAKQDGERTGEPAGEAGPAEATATGGPGEGDDPAFGATGDGGGEAAAEDQDRAADEDAKSEDEAVSPSPRRRGKK